MARPLLWLLLLASPAAAQGPDPVTLARQVDSLATSAIEKGPLAGLGIAVARGDKLLLAKGYGFADLENRVPATTETIFKVGSVTKQFTALAVMQLVEQKKIALTDDVSKYLPDVPLGRPITIAQLLDMTSGLKNYTAISKAFSDDTFRLELKTSRMAEIIKSQPPDFAPGTNWSYSNSGYYLAGMIVEKLSGVSYADYLRKHIFEPNGLTSTSFCDESAIVPGRARGYRPGAPGQLLNANYISMTVPYAAGALCSTVLDLVRYQRALVDGRIVSRASYARMSQPAVLKDGWRTAYGLGLVNDVIQGKRMVGHGGQIDGFWTVLFYYPADDVTVVLLSNVNPSHGETLWSIGFKLGNIALGFTPPAPADLPVTTAEQQRVTGKYSNPFFPFELVAKGDRIALAGLSPEPLPLARQPDGSYLAAWDPQFLLVPGAGCRIRSGAIVPLMLKCAKI
jgi:CubicO group peptidase (beta-lactamase class C family)